MKDRIAALAIGTSFLVSGCGMLNDVIENGAEYKAGVSNANGDTVDCYTNTEPKLEGSNKDMRIVFDNAICFEETQGAGLALDVPVNTLFSGEINSNLVTVIAKPMVSEPQN